ncbi:hypothetical protein Rsub_05679 [Raphidocelis subcapitata]|uniref:Uncharacterized protein n=1 Tax=Raphidocelis subcapitata TaxID=307507 RepID=A0A2V0NZK5_9CHLO|nr:hypothetical protein Rsub_05679 [Raphidocelis subcapitata]|eukprot:GBF93068.1 hypothetical protein Rsub_05679 [Raphidocelis subcapitata]
MAQVVLAAIFLVLLSSPALVTAVTSEPQRSYDAKKKVYNPLCGKSPIGKALKKGKCSDTDALAQCTALAQQCNSTWANSTAVLEVKSEVEALKAEIAKIQAEIDGWIGSHNNSKPFDSATCLAKNITSFKTDYVAGTRWVAVDFFPGGSNEVCERSTATTTCANICARAGLTCDPCALAKFGWAMQQCDPSGNPIPTDFYGYQKNYWIVAYPETYIDPATLCNLPIVTRDEYDLVMFSGLCYCSM